MKTVKKTTLGALVRKMKKATNDLYRFHFLTRHGTVVLCWCRAAHFHCHFISISHFTTWKHAAYICTKFIFFSNLAGVAYIQVHWLRLKIMVHVLFNPLPWTSVFFGHTSFSLNLTFLLSNIFIANWINVVPNFRLLQIAVCVSEKALWQQSTATCLYLCFCLWGLISALVLFLVSSVQATALIVANVPRFKFSKAFKPCSDQKRGSTSISVTKLPDEQLKNTLMNQKKLSNLPERFSSCYILNWICFYEDVSQRLARYYQRKKQNKLNMGSLYHNLCQKTQ